MLRTNNKRLNVECSHTTILRINPRGLRPSAVFKRSTINRGRIFRTLMPTNLPALRASPVCAAVHAWQLSAASDSGLQHNEQAVPTPTDSSGVGGVALLGVPRGSVSAIDVMIGALDRSTAYAALCTAELRALLHAILLAIRPARARRRARWRRRRCWLPKAQHRADSVRQPGHGP